MNCRSLRSDLGNALRRSIGLALFLALTATHAHAAPVCGNGSIEVGEACDDGNLNSGDGCSSICTIEQQCYDPGNTFSFFTWSDSYSSAGDGGVVAVFEDAVNRAKYPSRVIARFWISPGDIPFMADGNTRLDELNDELSNSAQGQNYPFACAASNGKFPYFVALGNHDVDGSDGTVSTTPQSQYDYWRTVVGPRLDSTLVGIENFRVGPSNSHDNLTTYSFDYKNAHFVIVNQYHDDPNFPTENPVACIRAPLYNWIDQDLAQTSRLLKFVFGHEPAWPFCSNLGGYGGEFCPLGSEDNQNPPTRPRPYSSTGPWDEAYGRHWGDSLEDAACPAGSREAFWAMLADHNVVAHYVGHTHTYSSRLVRGDGTRRNDVSAYAKAGASFDSREGVWEIDSGHTHNSAGAVYVLTTVWDNVVTFEAYDQLGTEPFKLIETWSVHFGNPPAVAITSPSAGATFTEPAEITITAEASDSDGSVTQVAFYAGATLIGVDTTSPFTVTWSNVAAGNYTLTAVATDNGGATTTSIPVSIAVYSPSANRPPVLAPIGDKAVDEQTLLSFTASATDPDVPANTLAFSLVGAPPGATIDASTGAFGWMPTEAQGPGTYQFTVRVTDNDSPALAADETITVTVNELNRAPVMDAIGNQSVNEGGTLSFTASATDPDVPTNTLAFSLAGAPLGATINSTTGAFSWTPTDAQGPGVYTFTVRVTDNGSSPLSAQESITVTVNEANQAPVLAPIGNQSVIEGGTLTFTGSASDADVPADTLTFSLAGAPNGAAIDPTSGAFSWTPSAAQGPGNYTLTVRVTDNGSPALSDQETITVTVRTAPDFRGPTTSAPRPTVTTVSLSATKPTIPAVRRRSRSLHESPRSD